MATTPPTQIPTWGTDEINNTDPGAAKQATGWAVNEVPSSGHINWLLNGLGSAADFVTKVMAPYIAHSNRVYTGSVVWDTAPDRHRSNYLADTGQHYVINMNTAGVTNVYVSADGITWGGAQALGDSNSTTISSFCSDGVSAFVAVDEKVYQATPTSFSEMYDFGGAENISGLVYDKNNSRFIAGGVGDIFHSSSGISWTAVTAPTNQIEHVAHNPITGRTIAFEAGTFDIWYSDNATTWNSYALTIDYDLVWYSPRINRFCGVRTSDKKLAVSKTGQNWNVFSDVVVDGVIDTPEFLLINDRTDHIWIAMTAVTENTTYLTAGTSNLGQLAAGVPDIAIEATPAINKGLVSCGGGIVYFPDIDSELVYSQYGPAV